ncbi:hypothetical protein MYX78_06390 [Acidobacteria bacterium AH-259-G07]|nr:hypothetical protein [Acidobacteria bacterium AH-259-G07]
MNSASVAVIAILILSVWFFGCVWLLGVQTTQLQDGKDLLRFLTVPRRRGSFLHAQAGVFLWDAGALEHYKHEKSWPDLDELILTNFGLAKRGNPGLSCPLRKILLPKTEGESLQKLLRAERVSQAHLMPTYDNVFETLKEVWESGAPERTNPPDE